MKIGILVTQTSHANRIIELTKASVGRGHTVSIFMTDDGVYLVTNSEVSGLRNLGGVDMSLCDFSANGRHIAESLIPEGVVKGTQYQNSLMHSECDKVLIF